MAGSALSAGAGIGPGVGGGGAHLVVVDCVAGQGEGVAAQSGRIGQGDAQGTTGGVATVLQG